MCDEHALTPTLRHLYPQIPYVLSQAGEGWDCLPDRYDDGGWSGGNMDRPAITLLLDDIRKGRVDIRHCTFAPRDSAPFGAQWTEFIATERREARSTVAASAHKRGLSPRALRCGCFGECRWRPEPESNRRARICNPLRHHSAIGPLALWCGARPSRAGTPMQPSSHDRRAQPRFMLGKQGRRSLWGACQRWSCITIAIQAKLR